MNNKIKSMWKWSQPVFKQHISWTDHVDNEEVLQKVNGGKKYLAYKKRRKANWVGHALRRNCRIKHVIKGKIKVKGRRGRCRKQLLDDLKEGANTVN
jgi:hypothetical protein